MTIKRSCATEQHLDDAHGKIECVKGVDKYVKTLVRGFRSMIK